MSKRIIISISSDFGIALARDWLENGHEVIGTYRTRNEALDQLEAAGAHLLVCDLANPSSVADAAEQLAGHAVGWDVLVQASGLQDPVDLFENCNFDAWETSLSVNFTAPLRLIHRLLPIRHAACPLGAAVILFAGGGTNNATLNYSAYTIAKIASIKFCELLDAEMPETRFVIIGPGWVKTKIHHSTLRAGDKAGNNYARTLSMLSGEQTVPMEKVVECVNWAVGAPRDIVGGRNFSLVHDLWGDPTLDQILRENPNMYKLRRSGNETIARAAPVDQNSIKSVQ